MNLLKVSIRHMLSAVVVLSMSATQARAVDLTGTWEGKAVCTGFFAGHKVKDTFEAPVTITQTGQDLNMEFFGTRYTGAIMDDSAAPTKKGQGSFLACSSQAQPLAEYNEIGHIKVVVNPTKGISTFTATSVYSTFFGGPINTVETCKYSFKRTSTVDPGVPECGNGSGALSTGN
jgi:hypothetical protein